MITDRIEGVVLLKALFKKRRLLFREAELLPRVERIVVVVVVVVAGALEFALVRRRGLLRRRRPVHVQALPRRPIFRAPFSHKSVNQTSILNT